MHELSSSSFTSRTPSAGLIYAIKQVIGKLWRLVATFSKYYGRWACVGKPVVLEASQRLMLQAVKADAQPYVVDDFARGPFVCITEANTCEDKGYQLMRDEEYRYKKMKRAAADVWSS